MFKKRSPSWLVAFLGNPGQKYELTRHNAGFLAAEALSYKKNIKINRIKYKALTALGELGGERVFFVKPQTYMNLSGESVAPAARFYGILPENIVIVFDDINIEPGKLRIRRNGSDGGHNGIKSIISHLGTSEFPRVKIGVGKPPHEDYDAIDWVIGKMTQNDIKLINDAAGKAVDALEELIRNGVDSAMNKFN